MDDYGFMDDYDLTDGTASDGSLPDDNAEEMDQQFKELTSGLMMPRANECLVCFLMRAQEFLLADSFAMVARFRDCNAPRATNTESRLMNLGAFDDRTVLQRAVMVNADMWAPHCCSRCGLPYSVPSCLGVRRGSTQPCRLWRWQADVARERRFGLWQADIGW